MRPTQDDYITVCRRLAEKHSRLKDRTSSHYVCTVLCLYLKEYVCNTNLQGSWKKKLRIKFRNLGRPARAHKAGITISPPAKKKKDDESVEPAAPSLSDMAEYEQHINYIKKSYSSQKWSIASMSQRLQETAEERRRWIREDCPSVKEVLLKYPCLAEPKLVSSCIQAYICTMYCAEKHYLCSLIFICTRICTCIHVCASFFCPSLYSKGVLWPERLRWRWNHV